MTCLACEKLRKALRPFRDLADKFDVEPYNKDWPDEMRLRDSATIAYYNFLTLGDCRKAKAALSAPCSPSEFFVGQVLSCQHGPPSNIFHFRVVELKNGKPNRMELVSISKLEPDATDEEWTCHYVPSLKAWSIISGPKHLSVAVISTKKHDGPDIKLVVDAHNAALRRRSASRDREEVRRIKHLNRLATWAQQDPTGPMNTEQNSHVKEWVLGEIQAALGADLKPSEWQPSYIDLQQRLATAEGWLRDELVRMKLCSERGGPKEESIRKILDAAKEQKKE